VNGVFTSDNVGESGALSTLFFGHFCYINFDFN
jgi:hypothetical protein